MHVYWTVFKWAFLKSILSVSLWINMVPFVPLRSSCVCGSLRLHWSAFWCSAAAVSAVSSLSPSISFSLSISLSLASVTCSCGCVGERERERKRSHTKWAFHDLVKLTAQFSTGLYGNPWNVCWRSGLGASCTGDPGSVFIMTSRGKRGVLVCEAAWDVYLEGKDKLIPWSLKYPFWDFIFFPFLLMDKCSVQLQLVHS